MKNKKENNTENQIRKTNKRQWNKIIKAQTGGLGPLFWPRELSAKPLPPNKDGGSAGVGIICQLLKMEAQTRGHKTFPGSNTPPKIVESLPHRCSPPHPGDQATRLCEGTFRRCLLTVSGGAFFRQGYRGCCVRRTWYRCAAAGGWVAVTREPVPRKNIQRGVVFQYPQRHHHRHQHHPRVLQNNANGMLGRSTERTHR